MRREEEEVEEEIEDEREEEGEGEDGRRGRAGDENSDVALGNLLLLRTRSGVRHRGHDERCRLHETQARWAHALATMGRWSVRRRTPSSRQTGHVPRDAARLQAKREKLAAITAGPAYLYLGYCTQEMPIS